MSKDVYRRKSMGRTRELTDLVTTHEASEILGRSVATINRWVREGRLSPAITGTGPTGTRFYRRSDVEALAS